MWAIWGVVIAFAVIFGTMSLASADETIPLIQDTRGLDSTVNFNVNIIYEIVLIPHPCDPLSNLLFSPDDPIASCAEVDEELLDFISEMSIEAIGFPINMDDLFLPEVTNLNDLEQQITQLDTTSELIFEHEENDLTITTQFEEEIKAEYQIIKDKWNKEMNELKNNAKVLFKQNPGMKSKILEQDIEKLKIKFDLREEKIKNTEQVQKKIKTAIELKTLKKEFQDSITEYFITEKIMKYGDEKDKKLEQLNKENKKLMKKMLIAEAKHHDKKLELNDFKKIDEKVAEKIKNSVSYDAGQTDNGDTINGNGDSGSGSDQGNSGTGSDNNKGNSGKGSDNKSKGSDNKGKGSGNSKGKGKSKN